MLQEPSFPPEKLKKSYLKLVNDIEFDQLELLNNDVTFFEIIGASKTEIRHSNFLAWILNPKASHSLGESFLKRFIREMVADSRAIGISEIEVEQLDFNNVRILREWKNIDILIEFADFVFVIENKILSKEHSNQLSRYRKVIEKEYPNKKHVFCYLSPNGDESVEENDKYVSISYFHIVDILERIMTVKGDSTGVKVSVYIQDYIKTLKKQVMETDESIDLARSIYKNHRELLDFIFEYKPDYKEPLKQIFLDQINKENWIEGSSTKTYLRFLTKDLVGILPNYETNEGWTGRESFLFELIFGSDKYVVFQAAVSPGIYSNNMKDILLKMDGTKQPPGKKWFSFFNTKMHLNYSKYNELEENEIREKVQSFIDKIKPIIAKVEKQLLDNKQLITNE